MSVNEWIGFAVACSMLAASFIAVIRWLVKHYLQELKPNGGFSLRDEQNRQGDSIKRLELRIDEIYRLMINE